MNHLSINAYTMNSDFFSQIMTKKQLKETLLATDGWILAKGRILDIKSKNLGVGIYKVTLEERD